MTTLPGPLRIHAERWVSSHSRRPVLGVPAGVPAGVLAGVFAAAGLLLVGASSISGQVVTGRVIIAETGEALELAAIAALGPDGEPLGTAFTNASGQFRLQLSRAAESFSLDARAFTYRASTLDSLAVAEGQTLNVPDITLERVPIYLDPLVVEADKPWVSPGSEWVRQGQLLGLGKFFAGAVIRTERPTSLTHYIAEKTGLRVTYNMIWEPYLRTHDPRNPCVRVQLNRWPLDGTAYISMDKIPLEMIAAIEVYMDDLDVPPALQWDAGRCALVNIWTWDSY